MAKTFKDLDVYHKAYNIALTVHKITQDFPGKEQYELASQMRRASKSICANIAEGFAKHHAFPNEFKRFIQISLGSSDEMLVWIDFAKDLGYLSHEHYESLYQVYSEISKMLFSLYRNWKT
jgi:four helix bundle protein